MPKSYANPTIETHSTTEPVCSLASAYVLYEFRKIGSSKRMLAARKGIKDSHLLLCHVAKIVPYMSVASQAAFSQFML